MVGGQLPTFSMKIIYNQKKQLNTMAFILTDEQLERICERSPECGCNCMKCEAMAANRRWHNGDYEDDEYDDE